MKKSLLALLFISTITVSHAKSSVGVLEVQTISQSPQGTSIKIIAHQEEVKLRGLNIVYQGDDLRKYKKVRVNYGEEEIHFVSGDPYTGKFVFEGFGNKGAPMNVARVSFPSGGIDLTPNKENFFQIIPILEDGNVVGIDDTIRVHSIWSNAQVVFFDEKNLPFDTDSIGGKTHRLEITRTSDTEIRLQSLNNKTQLERAIFQIDPNVFAETLIDDDPGFAIKYSLGGIETQSKFYGLSQAFYFHKGKKIYTDALTINIPFRNGDVLSKDELMSIEIIAYHSDQKIPPRYLKLKYILSNAKKGFLDGNYISTMDKEYLGKNDLTPVFSAPREFPPKSVTREYKLSDYDDRIDQDAQKLHQEAMDRKRKISMAMTKPKEDNYIKVNTVVIDGNHDQDLVESNKQSYELVKILSTGSPSEKRQLIKEILSNPNNYIPPVIYALSNALFSEGRQEEGVFWFYVGQLRARYDANRTADRTASSGIGILNMNFGPMINKYAFKDPQILKKGVNEAIDFVRKNEENYEPRWLAPHGMKAFEEDFLSGDSWSHPKEEWPTIKMKTIDEYQSDFTMILKKLEDEDKTIFTDLPTSHRNHKAIEYLKSKKILNGYDDGTFKPQGKINRAELLKILIAGKDIDLDEDEYQNCFPDVTDEWFAPYVCYAKAQGWVGGYPDGSFQPAKNVSKVESAKMIVEIYGLSAEDDSTGFDDLDENQWYARYIRVLQANKVLEETNGLFSPEQSRTRAEIAENIYRTLNR